MCTDCNSPIQSDYVPNFSQPSPSTNCDPCLVNTECDVKMDANCVFYNLYGGVNNLIKINLPNGSNIKDIIDRIDTLLGGGTGTTDQLVKVSSTDSTADYLINKVVAGDNITIVQENIGNNEDLKINALNNKVSTTSSDAPDYLANLILGGTDNIVYNTILQVAGKVQILPSIDLAALVTQITTNATLLNLLCGAVSTCTGNPCTPPAGLTASFTDVSSSVTALLNWTPGGGGGSQTVEYKLVPASSYVLFATVSDVTSTSSVTGLTENKLYNFRITNNCGAGSSTAYQITNGYITCPSVTLTPGINLVNVSFPNVGGDVTSYQIKLFAADGTTLISSQTIGSPFFSTVTAQFTGLNAATTYKVQVIPSMGSVSNTSCSQQSFTTNNAPSCLAPTTLQLTPNASGSVEATWTPQSGIISQEIYFSPASGTTGVPPGNGWAYYSGNPLNPSTSSVTFTGLSAQLFSVAVRSVCSSGYSPFTQVSINFNPQTVLITNQLANVQVINVTGITGYTFAGPLGVGSFTTGNHSSFTGSIGVALTGTAAASGTITLNVNGTTIQTLNVPSGPTGTTYNFTSATYNGSDIIAITLNIL